MGPNQQHILVPWGCAVQRGLEMPDPATVGAQQVGTQGTLALCSTCFPQLLPELCQCRSPSGDPCGPGSDLCSDPCSPGDTCSPGSEPCSPNPAIPWRSLQQELCPLHRAQLNAW